MGYRLFDTASAYKNEEEVGRGIRSCGLPRNEVFVTTKIWNNAQRIGNIESAFERSLDRLGQWMR
jgi:diketogulonate reductase-like aldo/keto reductase